MEDLLTVVSDNNKYRHIYDSSYQEGHTIERYDNHFCLAYTRIKKVSIVNSREFLIFTSWDVDEQGIVRIVCFQDDEAETLYPRSSNIVRGKIPMAGWLYTPLAEKPGFINI